MFAVAMCVESIPLFALFSLKVLILVFVKVIALMYLDKLFSWDTYIILFTEIHLNFKQSFLTHYIIQF